MALFMHLQLFSLLFLIVDNWLVDYSFVCMGSVVCHVCTNLISKCGGSNDVFDVRLWFLY